MSTDSEGLVEHVTDGLVNQIHDHMISGADVDWPELNDLWEEAFASSHTAGKSVFIRMVNPQPGCGGGSIMWRRKKRFGKKRDRWLGAVGEASIARFLAGGGLVGMAKRGEYP